MGVHCLRVIILLCFFAGMSSIEIPPYSPTCSYSLGDINIAVFAEMTYSGGGDECYTRNPYFETFVFGVETMAYAIRKINERTDILPNITMGFVVIDECTNQWVAAAQFLNLVNNSPKPSLPKGNTTDSIPCKDLSLEHHRIVGLYGFPFFEQAAHVSNLARIYRIPVLSHLAASHELTDKNRFKYFTRLLTSSAMDVRAILDFLQFHNWTYFSLVFREGPYGEWEAKLMARFARERGMCIAAYELWPLGYTDIDVKEIARKVAAKRNARVVVLFIFALEISKLATEFENNYPDFKPIWFGSSLVYTAFIGPLWRSGFVVQNIKNPDPALDNYLSSLSPSPNGRGNRWLPDIWEIFFGCSWKESSQENKPSCYLFENQTIPKSLIPGGQLADIVEVAQTYAFAIDSLIKTNCPEAYKGHRTPEQVYQCVREYELLDYLRAVEFEGINGPVAFDENGDKLGNLMILQSTINENGWEHSRIGIYEGRNYSLRVFAESIDWDTFNALKQQDGIPTSVCSIPCQEKEHAVPLEESPRCCWECRTCRPNEKLNENRTDCETCPVLTWPDAELGMICETIDPNFVNLSESFGMTVILVTVAGVMLEIVSLFFFIKYRNEKLIKASSRELSLIIFVGISLAYTTILLFILKPSDLLCEVRLIGFHFSVSFIFAPLFVRSNRIYRIFSAGKKGTSKPGMISNRMQVIFTSCLVCVQIVIIAVSRVFVLSKPDYRMPVVTERFVELNCTLPLEALLPGLVFNLILLFMCAGYGYLTRKLPENFNESWYNFVSVATTLFLWVVFIPAYFMAFYASHQVMLLCCCLFFNATITIICLFLPKIYAVYAKDEKDLNVVATATTTVAAK